MGEELKGRGRSWRGAEAEGGWKGGAGWEES